MIPKGVTVRKMGEPQAIRQTPRNFLERASWCGDLGTAKWMVGQPLGLNPDGALAQIHLSDADRWRQISPCSRLMEIAAWLHAECYEAMDLVESAAVSTVGD